MAPTGRRSSRMRRLLAPTGASVSISASVGGYHRPACGGVMTAGGVLPVSTAALSTVLSGFPAPVHFSRVVTVSILLPFLAG